MQENDMAHIEELIEAWENLDQYQRSIALVGVTQQIEGMKILLKSVNEICNNLITRQQEFLAVLSKRFHKLSIESVDNAVHK